MQIIHDPDIGDLQNIEGITGHFGLIPTSLIHIIDPIRVSDELKVQLGEPKVHFLENPAYLYTRGYPLKIVIQGEEMIVDKEMNIDKERIVYVDILNFAPNELLPTEFSPYNHPLLGDRFLNLVKARNNTEYLNVKTKGEEDKADRNLADSTLTRRYKNEILSYESMDTIALTFLTMFHEECNLEYLQELILKNPDKRILLISAHGGGKDEFFIGESPGNYMNIDRLLENLNFFTDNNVNEYLACVLSVCNESNLNISQEAVDTVGFPIFYNSDISSAIMSSRKRKPANLARPSRT